MPQLFDPLTIKSITIKNRIGVSPMCQYSSENGHATDWHLVHLGTRASGGAGMVMMEATAVSPEGRISPQDNGIYLDSHIPKLKQITDFIKSQGSIPALQIAHAGRKASRGVPWISEKHVPASEGGWQIVGPSAVAFGDGYEVPHELNSNEISNIASDFRLAAKRTLAAGFQILEIHAAHGYLLHSFLSPISNHRTDSYGGSFENRIRFLLETVEAVKMEWPSNLPLFVRLSCTDWDERGWTLTDSIFLAIELKKLGVDLIDCSSGAIAPNIKIPVKKHFQVPLAEEIKKKANIATAAVGLITEPKAANNVIHKEQADMVLLARELLRNPYWPIQEAQYLNKVTPGVIPNQYRRGF
ncbi:MAG: NADH:flavin oxidoreductase/NADH oxidase [Deltaproteobacteria bacterium]|nr:NADH:flavin oxidoreductase/NADH oxidase [Deltaproteobacteria bacterium]